MLAWRIFTRVVSGPIARTIKCSYSTVEQGSGFGYRMFLLDDSQQKVSFWKDLLLRNEGEPKDSAIINSVIEIPNNRIEKFEVCKNEQHHPIKQDVKKSKEDPNKTQLRCYAKFPLFNYGFLPQTWENNLLKDKDGYYGDNDPLDVVDLTNKVERTGEIKSVRVLGCFCLLDQGELDWKILVMSKSECDQKKIVDYRDYERHHPGKLEAIKQWFRLIKTYDGKPQNHILYKGQTFGIDRSLEVISEAYTSYQHLLNPEQLPVQAYRNKMLNLRKKYWLV